MLLRQPREQRQHDDAAERDRHVDAQRAARLLARAERLFLEHLQLGQHPLAATEQALPVVGERHLAGRAVEQPHAQPRFEAGHRLGERGRGASDLAGRCGEAAALGGLGKGEQGLQSEHG